jgi:addiction module HigA family antidote
MHKPDSLDIGKCLNVGHRKKPPFLGRNNCSHRNGESDVNHVRSAAPCAAILPEDVLPALNLTVTEAAEQLGESRVSLSRLLNERGGITLEMALRIEQLLGVERGGRADRWLDYDLWPARTHTPKSIKRAPAKAAA